jgi:hypothetical protein
MPCHYTGCGAAHAPLTAAWNAGQLCSTHLQAIRDLYPEATRADLWADIVKVHLLFHHRPTHAVAQIALLEAEMTAAQGQGFGPNGADPRFPVATQLKLSRALEYYEGYCWFPANRVLLTGLLSGPDFLKSLRYGFNKDHFPSRKHGEQSHRLQWHAIMRLATNGFTQSVATAQGWRHSPLELFYHMTVGEAPAAFARSMDTSTGANWANPDNVVTDLQGAGLPLVTAAVNKRVARHGGTNLANGAESFGTMDNAIMAAIFALNTAHEIQSSTAAAYDNVIRMIYKWRKCGVPTFKNAFEKDVKKVYDRAVVLNSTAVAPVDLTVNKTYKEKGANLLVKKRPPDPLVKIDPSRTARSRTGFNPDYTYHATHGARPARAERW